MYERQWLYIGVYRHSESLDYTFAQGNFSLKACQARRWVRAIARSRRVRTLSQRRRAPELLEPLGYIALHAEKHSGPRSRTGVLDECV